MGLIRYLNNQFRHDRNMKRLLNEQEETLRRIQSLFIEQRIQAFRELALTTKEPGVSDERLCDHEVVVSLTSFGQRIFDVPLAIESIMQGTVKPNRIVLWLSEEEFKGKPLPKILELQIERGLQVEFCEDIRSYKKLIPSLKRFPSACIITIDDDVIYGNDFVERFVFAHLEKPDAVCAGRIHKVKLVGESMPSSYLNWDYCVECYGASSPLLFPTGVGGVLYPPGCFTQDVFDQDVFMDICPYADDIWFYAMRLKNHVPITQVYTGKPQGYFMELPSGDLNSLSTQNTNAENCRNDIQFKAVCEKYQLLDYLR